MTNTATAGATKAPALPAELIGHFEPGTPAWHAARAHGIGGSEIAAVLGLSPHESRFSLWHRKAGRIGPVEESEEMYWGKVHEPAICARFAALHPELTVVPSPTYAAADRPWHIVNPDRLGILADGSVEVVEAKTSRDGIGWGEPGTDDIPVHYKAQVRWYCAALAARRAHVAVLIAGSEYREYVVERDQADEELMLRRGAEFIDSIAAGTPPPIDGHTATYAVVKQLPDGVEDREVEIPGPLRDRYFAALDACKAAEEEKRAASGEVLAAIGTGRRATYLGEHVATRTARNGRTFSLQPARTRSTT